jgi:hypothetical protein
MGRLFIADRLGTAGFKLYCEMIDEGVERGLSATYTLRILETQYELKLGKVLPKISERQVREHLKLVREGGTIPGRPTTNCEKVEQKVTGTDTAELETLSGSVRTVEDALTKGGVDRDQWDIERFVVNSWEVGAKGPDGTITTCPLWQVKVWLKAKKGWNPSEFRQILIDDLTALAPSYSNVPKSTASGPLLAELSIFDAHFGKLAWAPESGQDYDLKICENRYMNAGRDLLARAFDHSVERVLYVVGNDFFHTDQGRVGATSNGTPQDVDGRWQKAFRVGKDCCITLAEEAAMDCPVDILIVPGNHDQEKIFCLGEVLAARFHNHPNIKVLNSPDFHSYYSWGKTLLGFVHGQNHGSDKKRSELISTMATDRPVEWANSVWREIHLGHFHSESEEIWRHRSSHHIRDIAIRVLPSLSSSDAWHRASGYKSVLAAECHLYHKERGRHQYLVHQVDPAVDVQSKGSL